MTEAQLQGLWEIIAANNLEFFLEYESEGAWQTARHLHLLCEALESVEEKINTDQGARLMVFMPPRHGKSEVCTKKAPAYFEGRNPHWEIIISSYSEDLAVDHSTIAKETFERWAPRLWKRKLNRRSSAGGKWKVDGNRGGVKAAGVGGPLTGRGAHLLLIDDPFKNWEEANSPTIREKVWNWYRSVARTRLAPGAAVILIMTRWHEDDLAGRLLKAAKDGDGEEWEIINLPAEAEECDALGRQEGEYLWPERFSAKEYGNIRKAIGSFLWAALYQQRPSPLEGGIWKRSWWRYWTALPSHFDETIQSWDLTFKDSKTSAYVVGQAWGRKGADKYLLDQVREKMDFTATKSAIKAFSGKWPTQVKLIEDKANGPAIISDLKREIPGLLEVQPGGSKEERAQAVAGDIEAGNVYLPDPSIAPWVNDYLVETTAFPNSTYKDQVDTTSQALLRLKTPIVGQIPIPVGVGQSYWRGGKK